MPRPKGYTVSLTNEQRLRLQRLTKRGEANARVIRRAMTLLMAEKDMLDRLVADALGCSERTVLETRKNFALYGLEHAIYDLPRPGAESKLSAKQEAHLIALTCSDPPEGRERWTLRLLADRFVELGHVDEISRETVRRTLKKTS